MQGPIDIVIPWVDGNDPVWRAEHDAYDPNPKGEEPARYRDWTTFRYFFRGIEKFAPWVRKIHFVTWGHVPEWLDTSNPRIAIVRHADFIPECYLPTFSSHTIDLNIHRIPGLAERFIYCNDDTFFLRPTTPEDFFKRGLPRGSAVLCPRRTTPIAKFYVPMTNAAVISEHFNPRKAILRHPGKWLNGKYGAELLSTLLMLPYPAFYGFREYHLPNAFLKESFRQVWAAEPELLDETCSHKFREPIDVNQWLVENWQFASGKFSPRSPKFGKNFDFEKDPEATLAKAVEYITSQAGTVVCIGDSAALDNLEHVSREIEDALDTILPEACSFEKDR